jgi:predicted metal-dependent peptidase
MDILQRHSDALDFFSKEENYLAIQICKLGYPELTESISTAAVAWDDIKKTVKFLFNPKFLETVDDEEFRFILTHEAIHLLNNHVIFLKDKIEFMKRTNVDEEKISKFIRKYNVAADCVVNDTMTVLYGFKKIREVDLPDKPKIIYGKDFVDMDCHDISVMDVLYMIPDDKINGSEMTLDEHDWSSFFDKNGNLNKDFLGKVHGFIKSNIENSRLSDEDIEKIEKIKKMFEKHAPQQAGLDGIGMYRPVDGLTKIGLAWNKFFFQLVERKKQETMWNTPNRKLIDSYPDIITPTLQNEEKEDIFIAIDASGSIDLDALKLFMSVVKCIPKSYNVTAISFDTQCYAWDHKSDKDVQGGGGTNFGIIEDYLQKNLKKYPKAVFVLTDGMGTPVDPQYERRWCWVLYGPAEATYCKTMKKFNIKELLI